MGTEGMECLVRALIVAEPMTEEEEGGYKNLVIDMAGARESGDPAVLVRKQGLDLATKIIEQRQAEAKERGPGGFMSGVKAPGKKKMPMVVEKDPEGVASISECGDYNNMDPSRELYILKVGRSSFDRCVLRAILNRSLSGFKTGDLRFDPTSKNKQFVKVMEGITWPPYFEPG